MNSRESYSVSRLTEIYEYLVVQENSNNTLDYEIRIDHLIAVSRTNDTDRFFLFEEQLKENTMELLVLIFKGASRVSDKYCFVLKETPSSPSVEQQIQDALKREKEAMLVRFEMEYLRKKIKDQKQTIKDLRKSLQNVDTGSENLSKIISSLGSNAALKNLFSPNGSTSNSQADQLNGLSSLPDEEIISLLKHYRTELREEQFQTLLGTILKMAQTPELIPLVREFITTKINPS